MKNLIITICVALALTSCQYLEHIELPDIFDPPPLPPEEPPSVTNITPPAVTNVLFPGDNIGVENVVWLHTDVSEWPVTTGLQVDIDGSSVVLDYEHSRVWPSRMAAGAEVVANAWIFIPKDDTFWYGATWEWLRPGQTRKSIRAVMGDHIKVDPLRGFIPQSGEHYGFMVSGLARSRTRNVMERSNIVVVRWP